MWVLPYRPLRDTLTWTTRGEARCATPDTGSVDSWAWAVNSAGRFVPKVTCLMLSFAGKILLERRGLPCRLTIRVAKDKAGVFSAHAWLSCNGRVVLGGRESGRPSGGGIFFSKGCAFGAIGHCRFPNRTGPASRASSSSGRRPGP